MLDDYFRQYGLIVILTVAAIVVPSGMIMLSRMLSFVRVRPQKPTPVKQSIYECGMETVPQRWTRFNFRFYHYALLFLVFDVATVFLYPWATQFGVLSREFGVAILIAVFVFISILGMAWIYAWRKGALEWR